MLARGIVVPVGIGRNMPDRSEWERLNALNPADFERPESRRRR